MRIFARLLGVLLLGVTSSSPAALTAIPDRSGPMQFASDGHVLNFADDGFVVSDGSYALSVRFEESRPVAPSSDNARIDTDIAQKAPPALSRVTYEGLWPGIAVTYDVPRGGIARSTWTLAPGADPRAIRLRYNKSVEITSAGDLAIRFGTGVLSESRPVAWQEVDGKRRAVEVTFESPVGDLVGFRVGAYRPDLPLMIDPTLTWNSFLGGVGADSAEAIAVDASGNVYVAGHSTATWGSPLRVYTSGRDAFVAKLSASGALTWQTFLGGSGNDWGRGIAVDSGGNVYVAGYSDATWGSPGRAYTGGLDAFVAKLSSSGTLAWHSFLGGIGDDSGSDLTVDASGNVYTAGTSAATWGDPIRTYTSGNDAFAAKLSSVGAFAWSTFLGGAGNDGGAAIALDGNGNVHATGGSDATWGDPVRAYTSGGDAFAAKLSSSGTLTWNAFLGGSGYDYGVDVAVDGGGNVYVAGYSRATWGSPVRSYASGNDTFAAKLSSSGTLNWHTFLGTTGDDTGRGVAVDGSGNVYVSGDSEATWGTPVRAYTGGRDAFAAGLTSSGALTWHAFLGGSGDDFGKSVAVSGSGSIYEAGSSGGTWGAPIRAYTSGGDAFLAKLAPPTRDFEAIGIELRTAPDEAGSAVDSPVFGESLYPGVVWSHSGTGVTTVSVRIEADGTTLCTLSRSFEPGPQITTCPAPWEIPPGTHTVSAQLDYSQSEGELDEGNNTTSREYYFGGSPEIRIEPNLLTIAQPSGASATLVDAAGTTAHNVVDTYTPAVERDQPTDEPAWLVAKARQTGTLRVIARLRDPTFVPEGRLVANAARRQRASIAASQDRLLRELGAEARQVTRYETIPFVAVELTVPGLEKLLASPDASDVQEDVARSATLASSAPVIGAPVAWAAGYDGQGQTVAILDTGVDKAHPFFTATGAKVVSEACYSTNDASFASVCPGGVTESTASGSGAPCNFTGCDHGTWTAGIAAGNNGVGPNIGIASGATIIAIQVFSRLQNCSGDCIRVLDSDWIKAAERVYALRSSYSVSAVNLSIGGGQYTSYCDGKLPAGKAIIDTLASAGIATVVSAGNGSRRDAVSSPACISSAVSVGATTDADQILSFSNIASFVSLLAPGNSITSAAPGGGLSTGSGTSASAPMVAGAWAVLKQRDPGASVSEILNALRKTGKVLRDTRSGGTATGLPRVDLGKASTVLGSFTIFNDGNDTLNVESISTGAYPSPWLRWSPDSFFAVPPGGQESVDISVNFTLAPNGTTTRRLVVSSNDSDQDPYPDGVDIRVVTHGVCGDGAVNVAEECDDGNQQGGDCCAADCGIEDDGTSCNDGLYCNGADGCNAGTCSLHAGDPCVHGSECASACNEAADNCFALTGLACSSDGNGCTVDVCDGGGACVHGANSLPCDDGVYCNGADNCAGGSCAGHAGDPCPGPDGDEDCSEACDEVADSCNYAEPDGAACNDGGFCNGADTCLGGVCAGHAGDPCLGPDGDSNCAESCHEATDSCSAPDPNSAVCDDNKRCTTEDVCTDGVCIGIPDEGCSTTTTTMAADPCGDPNGDGRITASDALAALRAAVGSETCSLWICDFNGDGKVLAADALAILKKAVGQEVEPKCPEESFGIVPSTLRESSTIPSTSTTLSFEP